MMADLPLADGVGFLASILTLWTFLQSSMISMRIAALGANASFITFGIMTNCYPVLLLHVILLPINLYRLSEVLKIRRAPPLREPSSVALT